jgi:hypothetical protein
MTLGWAFSNDGMWEGYSTGGVIDVHGPAGRMTFELGDSDLEGAAGYPDVQPVVFFEVGGHSYLVASPAPSIIRGDPSSAPGCFTLFSLDTQDMLWCADDQTLTTALGVLPDAGMILTGHRNEVRAWDISTRSLVTSLATSSGYVTALIPISNSRVAAISYYVDVRNDLERDTREQGEPSLVNDYEEPSANYCRAVVTVMEITEEGLDAVEEEVIYDVVAYYHIPGTSEIIFLHPGQLPATLWVYEGSPDDAAGAWGSWGSQDVGTFLARGFNITWSSRGVAAVGLSDSRTVIVDPSARTGFVLGYAIPNSEVTYIPEDRPMAFFQQDGREYLATGHLLRRYLPDFSDEALFPWPGSLTVWDLDRRQCLWVSNEGLGTGAMVYLPEQGLLVTSQEPPDIHAWDAVTGELKFTAEGISGISYADDLVPLSAGHIVVILESTESLSLPNAWDVPFVLLSVEDDAFSIVGQGVFEAIDHYECDSIAGEMILVLPDGRRETISLSDLMTSR